ncbi:DUF1049 domain-containing protein [Mumia zhuanghuii]|uniref:DUF1049 domain-containing protein n=2 Tax=Mumia TaxID=1546255 RepID=A0ABW1QN88_9ACTN|nr:MULTISPECIES: DUF1049 domain-containing protein [Mumia]KAA1425137.1 DUF1049 domain-containing protein [Mumia zhuanghuii]
MIALGLLLLAVAVLAGVVATVEATDSVSVDVLGWTISTDGIGVFWAGAVTALVAVLGAWLIARGIRRGNRIRRENRELRKEHKRYEKEQASIRTGAPAAFAGDPDGRAGDPAYDPESERAYDPAHDADLGADASIVDPYDAPATAEPYDDSTPEPYDEPATTAGSTDVDDTAGGSPRPPDESDTQDATDPDGPADNADSGPADTDSGPAESPDDRNTPRTSA